MDLSVEGVITKEDFGIAQEHIWKSTKKEMKKKYPKTLGLFPMIVIGLIIGFSLNFFKESIRFDHKTILCSICIVSIFLLIFTKLYLKSIKKLPTEKGIYLGRHSFTIKEDGLHEESNHQSAALKWSGVQNIEETSNMIYIFVDSIAANFIPKHFFSNDGEAKKFVSALFEKRGHLQRAACTSVFMGLRRTCNP